MTAPIRLRCAVPGCNRTRGQRKGEAPIREGEEWVCGDHWRLVPKWMRGIIARVRKRYRRSPTSENIRSFNRIWQRCKREAIERGLGLK